MATNQDAAARFAAVITPTLADHARDKTLNTPEQVLEYTTSLPKKLRHRTKDNMSSDIYYTDDAIFGARYVPVIALNSNNIFMPLSFGYSYAEQVAVIVWNSYVHAPELWLCRQHFSKTTQAHKREYMSAYCRLCRVYGMEPRIYVTDAANTYGATRANFAMVRAKPVLESARERMYIATLPRLRDTTRVRALNDAKAALITIRDHMTKDLPSSELLYEVTTPTTVYPTLMQRNPNNILSQRHADILQQLDAEIAQIAALAELPMSEMRAAVAGLKALDTE